MAARRLLLPSKAYTSQDVFSAEMRDVFPSSWILVAELAEVATPGDYVATMIGQEPVLIVRDNAGSINAFANICPHRGTTLAEGKRNCGKELECPYHGWTFSLDGALVSIPSRKGFNNQLHQDQLNLRPLRLETWERFIFVNIDESAPALSSYLEAVPALLAQHGILDLSPTVHIDDIVDVNWKLLVDNALDDYHLPVVHAHSLQPTLEGMKLRECIGARYASILCMPLNESGRMQYLPRAELGEEQARSTYAIDVFPNLTIIALPDGGLSTLRFDPISVSQTAVQFRSYSHGLDELESNETKFASGILNEDYRIMHRVQQGIRSRHFEPGPAHYLEGRVATFHTTLLDLLGEELELS
jgi:phenylpropionate dioxygenase-like ring-hydroxylating dioxygenase large terminal subunit|tara:strand:+ start:268 stop:1341 length:1074 start_codon:yes stop_codon:yes gene_type:complete